MIRKYFEIDKGAGNLIKGQQELDVAKALLILVDCELGWGATVKTCVPQVVEVNTVVMGQKEMTRFEGSVADMKTLYRAAVIAQYISAKRAAENGGTPFSKGEIAWAAQRSEGNPRVLEMGGVMLASMGRPKMIYTSLLAESTEQVEHLYKLTQRDLYELVVMKHINQESIDLFLTTE